MPEISVIIPCYNVELYIDRCLTSIVNQDIGLDYLQIICVDDASTDNTWACLQKWEAMYPDTVLLIHCDKNGRQGTARNIGMQYVNTPYVSFIDADDWIDPDYYRIMCIPARELDCEVVCCRYERDSSEEATICERRETGQDSRYICIDSIEKRKILLHNRIMEYSCWGKLIKTDLLLTKNIYFPENLAYEDTFWSSFLHLYAERIFILEEKLYHYFVNDASTILMLNSFHHTDYMTVFLQLWNEWHQRGFFEAFQDELEYDYLYSFYFHFLRISIIRFSVSNYSLFQLLRQLVIERIPDYRTNPYIEEHFNEFHKLMLQPLLTPVSRQEYLLLAKNAQIYWAIQHREK